MTDEKKPKETKEATPAVSNDVAMGIALGMKQMAEMLGLGAHPVLQSPAPHVSKQQCQLCGQNPKTGCEGKHERMVVYPEKYADMAGPFFNGVIINDHKYISNGPGHEIDVPANCVANIRSILDGFEREVLRMFTGKNKSHNSGTLSGSGNSNVTPYNGAGFA